ncbi:MAG TPA: NAD(P)-dependent alcohol dehydrogenase [Terriglobales bacterium]|nr:NAD(P)-dependent alcohol dehydrogenase [Terriglobales bacterium]
MKAAVHTRYGPPNVVQITDVEKPSPKDSEVLIRVRAASVNPVDWHLMEGKPSFVRLFGLGLLKPKDTRLGRDVAGQVEAVGKDVTQFKPGDQVFGACPGGFAEYACASESRLAMKPDNVTFEQAASVAIAALTALQGLRDKGQIQPGQKVLINGAAGGVGTFAVQIAKSFGADVTGVCSTRNVDMVRSIGADRVIDYTQEDFTKSGQRYDLIFDLVATHSLSAFRRVLNPTGIYVGAGIGPGGSMIGFLARAALTAPVLSRFASQKFVIFITKITKQDLTVMRDLMEARKVTPVIERRYRLSEVPEAIRYLATGHARAKLVITLESNNKT